MDTVQRQALFVGASCAAGLLGPRSYGQVSSGRDAGSLLGGMCFLDTAVRRRRLAEVTGTVRPEAVELDYQSHVGWPRSEEPRSQL